MIIQQFVIIFKHFSIQLAERPTISHSSDGSWPFSSYTINFSQVYLTKDILYNDLKNNCYCQGHHKNSWLHKEFISAEIFEQNIYFFYLMDPSSEYCDCVNEFIWLNFADDG